jgi:hypothetical protein
MKKSDLTTPMSWLGLRARTSDQAASRGFLSLRDAKTEEEGCGLDAAKTE